MHRPALLPGKVESMREKSMETKLVAAVKAVGGVCWKFTSPGTAACGSPAKADLYLINRENVQWLIESSGMSARS